MGQRKHKALPDASTQENIDIIQAAVLLGFIMFLGFGYMMLQLVAL